MSQRENGPPLAGSPDRVQDFYDRYPYPRPVDSLQRAQAFFERLWWYDQVVFDASKGSG